LTAGGSLLALRETWSLKMFEGYGCNKDINEMASELLLMQ
jgi:hypothetical protein